MFRANRVTPTSFLSRRRNLKTAKQLGMDTIRAFNRPLHPTTCSLTHVLHIPDVPIGGSRSAIEQLGQRLGMDLGSGINSEALSHAKL